jgi:hypothetical protein
MTTVEELAAEVAALRRRVEASEGVLELQSLKARYGELVDQRFGPDGVVDDQTLTRIADEVAALFTVDGVWDGGPALGRIIGRAAIAERLRTPTLSFSRHLFVKPRIRVEGHEAGLDGTSCLRAVASTAARTGCADSRTTTTCARTESGSISR